MSASVNVNTAKSPLESTWNTTQGLTPDPERLADSMSVGLLLLWIDTFYTKNTKANMKGLTSLSKLGVWCLPKVPQSLKLLA